MVVQNLQEAAEDFNKIVTLYPDFILARFNRAVINYKLIEIERYNQSASRDIGELSLNIQTGNTRTALQNNNRKNAEKEEKLSNTMLYDKIISDYTEITAQNPEFVYARFNRGNIYCLQKDYRSAIMDYNEVIAINPYFAEAWFNRGLTRLYIGDTDNGIDDLSRAGELGVPEAYGIIKKMSSN